MTYLLMALLSACAMLLLTRPWWQRGGLRLQRRAANVVAYKTRLAELENDVRSGMVDAAAAEQMRLEMGARLLNDADAVAALQKLGQSRLWLMALVLPCFAAAWYYAAGSWRTQGQIELARDNPAAAQQASVDEMVQKLAARLQAQPEDAEGWAMLGRSYSVLERFAEAAAAYSRANALSEGKFPDWLVGEGESLALSRDRDLLGRPQQLFEAALKLQPDNIGALWFAGLASAQADDYAQARKHWSALSALPLPENLRAVLDERLNELATRSGEPITTAKPAAPPAAETELALNVEVSLAAELQKDFSTEQTLFVFAKAEQGPPMPLAVQKIQPAPQLPLSVKLDDTMGMMPSLKLSQFERWTVTARLTRSGSVQAGSGDLEGVIAVGRAQAGAPLKLVINRKLP